MASNGHDNSYRGVKDSGKVIPDMVTKMTDLTGLTSRTLDIKNRAWPKIWTISFRENVKIPI